MIVSTAHIDDLPGVFAVEKSAFSKPERWSKQSWAAELEQVNRLVLISREADEIEAVACFSVLGDTAELLRIAVHPDRRQRGIARRLVGIGKEWAEAAGADRMLLEVRHDNDAALAMYQTTGFEPIAKRRDYYGPQRDAVVMECRLPKRDLMQHGRWIA